MARASIRDIANLRREDLLDDYAVISKRRKGALVATALRTKSVSMRDILVHAGVRSDLSSEELKQLLLSGNDIAQDISDIDALEELGRLVLLQNILEHDDIYGEKLLSIVNDYQLSQSNLRLLIQRHILNNHRAKAINLLDQASKIDGEFYGYLRHELENPFTIGSIDSTDSWLLAFNQPFEDQNLTLITLDDRKEISPFDRLMSIPRENEDCSVQNELVSVVLTAYRPDTTRLLTSIKSILDQTWRNLEIIVVDDCSGPSYMECFRQVDNLDPRIQVIHTAENRGTYAARNIGYGVANGTFITGQDDDDWSHPQRLERQVNYLESNLDAAGCRVNGIMCDENLGRVRLGYKPLGPNASSLMIRRDTYEKAGAFLEARKAADTEYFYRVGRVTGQRVATLPEPLSIVRILPDSLSRSDFAPGWRHSSRRAFRSSYEYWHRNSSRHNLCINTESRIPIKVPRRFMVDDETASLQKIDVIFAGDWQSYGGPQKSMLEEIYALTRLNYKIGVLNLEAGRFMNTSDQATLNDEIQRLINNGFVDEVLYDEFVHSRLLILRYPPILQFFTYERSNITVDCMLILANQAPAERDGTDIRYLVDDCHKNAETAFGREPIWVPQGPQVREFLELYLSRHALTEFDMPGILDLDDWWHEKLWYRSTLPIVGRHSRDDAMKWPDDPDILREVYPIDGRFDVRFMGGAKTPLKILGKTSTPSEWIVYKKDEIPVKDFLHSLDYFVFYQHRTAIEAFGRAILEALASGVIVILPRHFEPVFGEAALYCEADDVSELIFELHSDFALYKTQIECTKKILTNSFSYASYQMRIQKLLTSVSA